MSKSSKSASKERRRQQKRARKAAKRAQYAAFGAAGQNTKSKRARMNAKRAQSVKTKDHPNGKCGNVGCAKCYVHSYAAWLGPDGKPNRSMPQRLYNRYLTARAA